jgi:hypothetical protein
MIEGSISNKVDGTLEINSTQSKRTIVLKDKDGKISTSLGMNGISTPALSVDGISLNATVTYSLSEARIGTWIDGKPIYRKVINKTGNVSANTWFTVEAMPNVDTIVNHYVIFDYGLSGSYLCRIDNNNFEIYIKESLRITKAIVEYTKTTD